MQFRIIVVTSPRTGSTAYSAKLANQCNFEWFTEPHQTPDKQQFESYFYNNCNFVVKFMAEQIEGYQIYNQLLQSDCYKIKLLRKNVIDQILSFYIANVTNVWNHGKLGNNKHRGNEAVVIDLPTIEKSILSITQSINLLNTLPYAFNQVLYYEDLGDIQNSYDISKLPAPSNVDEIRQIIINSMSAKGYNYEQLASVC